MIGLNKSAAQQGAENQNDVFFREVKAEQMRWGRQDVRVTVQGDPGGWSHEAAGRMRGFPNGSGDI